jgi:hypothetical protein
MPDVPSAANAGWFPGGSGQLRYWDGSTWTQHVAPMVQPAPSRDEAAHAAAVAAQQAESTRAANAARMQSERAAEAARVQAARVAEAGQQRAARIAQRAAEKQAKAAQRAEAARSKAERAAAATVAAPVLAPTRTAPIVASAPVAPAAPSAVLHDTRPGIHSAASWIVASVAALVILISSAVGGFRGMFVSLGLVALAAALYTVVLGRRGFVAALTSRPRGTATAVGAVLMLIVGAALPAGASASAPAPALAAVATATASPSATPTPSASPSPMVHVVEDVNAKTATDARALLREAGYVVQYVLESGEATSLTAGMTVKSQSPAAGSRVDAGCTVTLTLLAPAPTPTPTPEPTVAPTVAPAPVQQPAAPAPAPVAPAPAPAAAAPAPAPAPAPGRTITPGAFCKKTEVGSIEKSDTGKSYRCGPDADLQRNRWYPI